MGYLTKARACLAWDITWGSRRNWDEHCKLGALIMRLRGKSVVLGMIMREY